MEIVVEDLARKEIDDIFSYNLQYSYKNAIETDMAITHCIQNLETFPYIGRTIPELDNKHFREIIYRKTRHSAYRIMYYISQKVTSFM